MPYIRVDIMKGRTVDQRREFVKRVTAAAIECLDAAPEKVSIIFRELDPADLARAGVLVLDQQTARKDP